jgi:hypothetical protein
MRFPIDVPVSFWWQDSIGERQQVEGHTYDVSELGAFVLASRCPPPGAHVNVKISIGALPDAPRGLRMEIEGLVLRVEQIEMGQRRDGFAILSTQAILHDGPEGTEEREVN